MRTASEIRAEIKRLTKEYDKGQHTIGNALINGGIMELSWALGEYDWESDKPIYRNRLVKRKSKK